MGGDGVSPDGMGYFGSPRPDRGSTLVSGLTPGHSSGLTPGQFFLFGASGRTPSSAPFSAGVSDVDSGYRNKRGGCSGGLLSSALKNGFRNRTDFYRTGLTPAAADSDSPPKLSNNNTPLSEIGDISISSSVFSPSFSPRSSYIYPSSNGTGEREIERDRERERGSKDKITKSPRTEEALKLLADCIDVSQGLNSEKSNRNMSALPTPSSSPSTRNRNGNGNSNNARNNVNYGSSPSSVFLPNNTLSATSVEKSFSLCQKHFPMVSTRIARTIYMKSCLFDLYCVLLLFYFL
jgi:hypothetical protein